MPLVELRQITKSYGGVTALRALDLSIEAGQILAVCGENGAGKSTLNKILAGIVTPDSGELIIDGKPTVIRSVADAEDLGIVMVHQESAAFLHLNAYENHEIMSEPGRWWLDRSRMRTNTEKSLADVDEKLALETPLEHLSVAQRQMVAIARAANCGCRLLILDEPTASLSNREAEALFRIVRKLRDAGVAVVYVSHRLDEILDLADRVVVLRDGTKVSDEPASSTTPQRLVEQMVGREVEFQTRQSAILGETRLQVTGLTSAHFKNISFEVRSGEVVALAGLVGAGRSELARAIFGLDPIQSGTVFVEGIAVKRTPEDAIRAGIHFVPEDRQHQGLHLPLAIQDNLAMAAVPGQPYAIDRKTERTSASALAESLAIKMPGLDARVSSLSGGNQQKVLLGKWLNHPPKLLILDEPTRGVDVGAKDQIHRLVSRLAEQGVAILVISSELPEVLALADRTLVMREGRIAGELSRENASQQSILDLALPSGESGADLKRTRRSLPREAAIGAVLLAVVLVAAIVNPSFIALENIRDILVRIAPVAIVASAMTMLILAREIDISVGSLMGLCAASLGIAGSLDHHGLPPPLAAAVCMGVGLLGGLVNGALVVYVRLPSIVVTLATLTMFRAGTEWLMEGKWIENMSAGLRHLGTGSWIGIPIPILVSVLVAALAIWVTRKTAFGLRVYALGSNPDAARLVGIDSRRIRLALFCLVGLGAGLASLVSATQLQVIESGFGSNFELAVIAAVVVGGTSIRGGVGSIVGSLIGVALLGMISNVLIFLRLGDAATYWERAIQGLMILVAVFGDHLRRRSA